MRVSCFRTKQKKYYYRLFQPAVFQPVCGFPADNMSAQPTGNALYKDRYKGSYKYATQTKMQNIKTTQYNTKRTT